MTTNEIIIEGKGEKKKSFNMASKIILVDQANNLKCSANIEMQEIVEHM